MSLLIGKAVYNILSNDKKVTNKVLQKIFPIVAAVDTSFPFIIYKRTGIVSDSTKDRTITGEEVYISIIIASDKYNESIEVADLVRKSLQEKKGIFSGIEIKEVTLTDADEDYIEDTFILNLTFKIKIQYGKVECRRW